MALDGLVIANLRKELADKYTGARINKIAQPEPDELLLTLKTQAEQSRLLIYYTNYSMSIAPKIDGLERLADG